MENKSVSTVLEHLLERLEHYLPTQAPLKDFIHHNTLHAFQPLPFHKALAEAKAIFGYQTYLSLTEYRELYNQGKINKKVLEKTLLSYQKKGLNYDIDQILHLNIIDESHPSIGAFRAIWKNTYQIDLNDRVHPFLFRIVGAYLDQGLSIWNFPIHDQGFFASIRELEKNSRVSMFKSQRVKNLVLDESLNLELVLNILVGDLRWFEHYLFDQQLSHPGWSGMVSVIQNHPDALIDQKKISLYDFVLFECLLEIDVLDQEFGTVWSALSHQTNDENFDLFAVKDVSVYMQVCMLWHEAYEWTYYDQVISGLQQIETKQQSEIPSFQMVFCIDDRECSLRRYIEEVDKNAQTFGTAGFFNVAFYYQASNSKSYTKLCPAPLTPTHLVKEIDYDGKRRKDFHFNNHSSGLLMGWLITHSLAFWSALKLFVSIFFPKSNAGSVSSFLHMHPSSKLTIENVNDQKSEEGLQIGFKIDEMADRVEGLLRSIGLTENFAHLVYIMGHGSSSVNNTHYSGYDCGACSGRPGSVNARLIAAFANHSKVRQVLQERGLVIPKDTQFVAGLHDTARDEMQFYDLKELSVTQLKAHELHYQLILIALSKNAKERSRRFILVDTKASLSKVHQSVKKRTVALFEPRPELNHSNNTLCIVGNRSFSERLFLDRRSFLNSYDYQKDSKGDFLLNILNAVTPVCGGINLEYFFSRVDNSNLGAGTKLPHNVVGLIGVSNGTDGDLRTGLPSQMIEVHDPMRLLVIIEQKPQFVLEVLSRNKITESWYQKEWLHLIVIHPETKVAYQYIQGQMHEYTVIQKELNRASDLTSLLESSHENLPVTILN